MNCIIVDDEPLAREGIQLLIDKTKGLKLSGSFSNAHAASLALGGNSVDLVFLDIQMPGINGIDFAKTIPPNPSSFKTFNNMLYHYGYDKTHYFYEQETMTRSDVDALKLDSIARRNN